MSILGIVDDCLQSTVRNTSGTRRVFSFLPPHGKELADNEEYSFSGDIREAMFRGDRFGHNHWNAMISALEDDALEILSTPAPIFYDEVLLRPKSMVINGGSISITDPCWETSISTDGTEVVGHD